ERALERLRDVEDRERLDRDDLVADPLCELERTSRPLARLAAAVGATAAVRERRVRQCELAARRQRLEQVDRLARAARRLRRSSRAPEEVRKPGEHVALPQPVVFGAMDLERVLERGDAFVVMVGDVARLGLPLEQLRALGRRPTPGEANGPGI